MPRLDLAGTAQHIVQRGHNRLPCFLDDADRLRYLRHLQEAAIRHECAIHAYVLMTNHVHLLATPALPGAVSRMMQMLGRNYAGYFNVRHARSGSLWERRFSSCLVDTDAYLLCCYRYIELNPLRAAMVEHPGHYRWSSYGANALGEADALVMPHAQYLALGISDEPRRHAYVALVAEPMSEVMLQEIRLYLQQQRALGTDRFRACVEAKTRRFSDVRPAHRPRKHAR